MQAKFQRIVEKKYGYVSMPHCIGVFDYKELKGVLENMTEENWQTIIGGAIQRSKSKDILFGSFLLTVEEGRFIFIDHHTGEIKKELKTKGWLG